MKKEKIHDIIFVILELSAVISFFICLFLKKDFIVMQLLFFLLALNLSLIIQTIFKIKLSFFANIVYESFLLLHFLFGEIINFYVTIPIYDSILHFFSSIFLCILGKSIIQHFLKDKHIGLQLFFAFMFSLSCEFVWEIIEYIVDHCMHTNMQRYIKNGVELLGHMALYDTMKDMMITFIGCIVYLLISQFKVVSKLKIFEIENNASID